MHSFIRSFDWALCGSEFDALSICVLHRDNFVVVQTVISISIFFSLVASLPSTLNSILSFCVCVCFHSYFYWTVRAHISISVTIISIERQYPPLHSNERMYGSSAGRLGSARSCIDWLILDYLLCATRTHSSHSYWSDFESLLFHFTGAFYSIIAFSMDFGGASQ